MNEYTTQPIVVPWDFSKMSHDALSEALELAHSPEQIEVVHVTPFPSTADPSVFWGNFSETDIRENLTKSFRTETADAKFANVEFTALFGDPGSEIADFAKKLKAGLIVISSHGRTGLERMLLGSVAERVVRLAHCPVLVLRAESQPKNDKKEKKSGKAAKTGIGS